MKHVKFTIGTVLTNNLKKQLGTYLFEDCHFYLPRGPRGQNMNQVLRIHSTPCI